MVQVVVENTHKKRRKRSSSDNHSGIILISSITNLRELLFPPLFVFAFFLCVLLFCSSLTVEHYMRCIIRATTTTFGRLEAKREKKNNSSFLCS